MNFRYELYDHMGVLVDTFAHKRDAEDYADELCDERHLWHVRRHWYTRIVV